jgi:hypothetical protein
LAAAALLVAEVAAEDVPEPDAAVPEAEVEPLVVGAARVEVTTAEVAGTWRRQRDFISEKEKNESVVLNRNCS